MNRRKTNVVSFISVIAMISLILVLLAVILSFLVFDVGIFLLFFIAIGLFVIQGITSFWILNSKRITNVKMCWIFIINFVPIFGIAAFFIFGVIPFRIKTIKELKVANAKFNQYENYDFTQNHLEKNPISEFAFCNRHNGAPVYKNNKYTLLDQSELVATSLDIIRKAEKFINIQYFIVADSFWFDIVIDELIKKVKEGIKVRFLYDWAGSHKRIKRATIKKLEEGGIKVAIFNPQNFNHYTSNTNFRSHRKSIIVDNKYCLTGGSNLSDEYLNLKKGYDNWLDLNFLIEGEIVNSINLQFYNDWINFSSSSFFKNKDEIKIEDESAIYSNIEGNNISQVIHSGPDAAINPFTNVLISKISTSKKKITMVSPYFLLQESIVSLLVYMSLKGVEVNLLFPHFPDDKKYILTMNRSNYSRLLEAKVNIYEYKGFLHSKFFSFDDESCLLGTNNMDYRSLIINFETGILIQSQELAKQLDEIKEEYKKNSIQITKSNFSKFYRLPSKIQMYFINIIHPLL